MNDRSTLKAAEEAPPDPGSEEGRLRSVMVSLLAVDFKPRLERRT
jgi:hypothetical protein